MRKTLRWRRIGQAPQHVIGSIELAFQPVCARLLEQLGHLAQSLAGALGGERRRSEAFQVVQQRIRLPIAANQRPPQVIVWTQWRQRLRLWPCVPAMPAPRRALVLW